MTPNKQLKNVEDAIRQAIEGGYNYPYDLEKYIREGIIAINPFIDPAFWQALGKARGWDSLSFGMYEWMGSPYHKDSPAYEKLNLKKWEYFSLKWFSTRMSNGDEEKFWQSLP